MMYLRGPILVVAAILACLSLAGCQKTDKLPECTKVCAAAVLPYGQCLVSNADDTKVPTDAYGTEACRTQAKECKVNPTPDCDKAAAECVLNAGAGKPPVHPWSCRDTYVDGAKMSCNCSVD